MTKETSDLKAQLLRKLKSGDLVVVKEGIDSLRLNGWLSDGSLQN